MAAPISQFGSSPRVVELLVSEGDFVKKGDILAIFENQEKLVADLERNKNLINTENPAILLTTDKYNVTKEGDPWYTSGTHVKNGNEAILNEKPEIISISEKIINNWVESSKTNLPPSASFNGIMPLKNVEPDNP